MHGSFSSSDAAPNSDLWGFWKQYNEASELVIDHSLWQDFLTQYLVSNHPSRINRVDYARGVSSQTTILSDYLKEMQRISIFKYNQSEQKAYWINLYNALTVKVILDHYPVESIRDIDISPGWFSNGPWDAKLFSLNEKKLSLNDIEHRILRPIWQDNRIHYAVNCASLGCPNLLETAYTGQNTEKLLERATIDYINHKRGVAFIDQDTVQVSSIYKWYEDDFGDSEEDLIRYLQTYLTPNRREQLKGFKGDIAYDYNWNLNKP